MLKMSLKSAAMALTLAFVVMPTLASAEAIVVGITSPADGANVTLNQDVTFTGTGTGGSNATYTYYWKWGDNTESTSQTITHKYVTTGPKTVELRITDVRGNTGTKTITVNVVDGTTPTDVVISNIRVTDVTKTSAVIRWTTDVPSTSRVIYDVVSHSSITGQTAPNYGYANSSAKIDIDTKVTEHAVTLTGLTANTHYFFRVLSAK